MGKNRAFTLAEVLITLAVIGVVGALTIPAVVKNFQQNSFHAAFKKNYSMLSQAFTMLKIDHGGTLAYMYPQCSYENCFNNALGNDLKNYLRYTKWCEWGQSLSGGCMYENGPKWLNESTYMWDYRVNDGAFILNNGAIFFYTLDCSYTDSASGPNNVYTYAQLYIDVNGFKGPNIWGKDVYGMNMTEQGIVPFGSPNAVGGSGTCILGNTDTNNNGLVCAVKVLKGEDY